MKEILGARIDGNLKTLTEEELRERVMIHVTRIGDNAVVLKINDEEKRCVLGEFTLRTSNLVTLIEVSSYEDSVIIEWDD